MINKIDLFLDSVLSFKQTGRVFSRADDGTETPIDITGWQIIGTIIVDRETEASDLPITGIITDAVNGLYEISISDADRDIVFETYDEKLGVLYELKFHFPDDTGDSVGGTINLNHSRDLSKKV